MTNFLFANNATTTLGAAVKTTDTTIQLASGTGALFPSPTSGQQFALTMVSASIPTQNEIVYCTARSGDQLTVVRAQEGTTAQSFNVGDEANNFLTAGVMAALLQPGSFLPGIPNNIVPLSGSNSWTVPANVFRIKVTRIGGGGGGGGAAAGSIGTGGGAGASAVDLLAVTPGQQIAYSCGTPGAGGTPTSNGGNGGSTTFGTQLNSVSGGSGGQSSGIGLGQGAPAPVSALGLAGGSGSGGFMVPVGSGTSGVGGRGGDCPGYGAGGTIANGNPGNPGTDYGSGGSGAGSTSSNAYNGAPGQGGLIIVEY